MAKQRKNYISKKRPAWQWIVFYLVIGGIVYSMLYLSGVLNDFKIGGFNSNNSSDYRYFE